MDGCKISLSLQQLQCQSISSSFLHPLCAGDCTSIVTKRSSKSVVTFDSRVSYTLALLHYNIPKSSTSKYNVAPPGITPPAPRSPYPRRGGMII